MGALDESFQDKNTRRREVFRSGGQGSDRDVVVITGGGRVGCSGGCSAGCDGEGRGGGRGESERQAGGRGSPPLYPAPPTDTFWTPQPPDAGATRTALAAQVGVEPPRAHRLFIAVCDGGSPTRRKGRGCEDLRARAEATEARDASNNGASQPSVTSVTRRLWANSLTVSPSGH
jgi:hypothetical protein